MASKPLKGKQWCRPSRCRPAPPAPCEAQEPTPQPSLNPASEHPADFANLTPAGVLFSPSQPFANPSPTGITPPLPVLRAVEHGRSRGVMADSYHAMSRRSMRLHLALRDTCNPMSQDATFPLWEDSNADVPKGLGRWVRRSTKARADSQQSSPRRILFSYEGATVCASPSNSELRRHLKEMNILPAHRSSNPRAPSYGSTAGSTAPYRCRSWSSCCCVWWRGVESGQRR
jgi:hypothetical protein